MHYHREFPYADFDVELSIMKDSYVLKLYFYVGSVNMGVLVL